jgi:hypothetical protein
MTRIKSQRTGGDKPMLHCRDCRQGGFKIGAPTAVSALSGLRMKFARTRPSALLFSRFLNPPWIARDVMIDNPTNATAHTPVPDLVERHLPKPGTDLGLTFFRLVFIRE